MLTRETSTELEHIMTKIITAISDILENRRVNADNEGLAKKFEAEKKVLTTTEFAAYFEDNAIDVAPLSTLAIYAMQKLRKLVAFGMGKGSVDQYTRAILTNAAALADAGIPFTNGLQMATLSASHEAEHMAKLPTRLASTRGTANTQASSSRKALELIGAAKVDKKDGAKVLVVDFGHPIVANVLKTGGKVEKVAAPPKEPKVKKGKAPVVEAAGEEAPAAA